MPGVSRAFLFDRGGCASAEQSAHHAADEAFGTDRAAATMTAPTTTATVTASRAVADVVS
jgi:hypothetical protein